ncbi:NAD(P)-dependent oxidoreductase [Novosphingobium sp. ZN18A2]|uniref:NAD-dependent epimerase/dehydratase family protein n=1 Tax=Novosphingobium sp. ZN18A2 TaxID=3079861 RepID=UPI0030D48C91
MQAAKPSSRYVLTGPSGWIGRSMLDVLSRRLGESPGDQVVAFGSSARSVSLRDGRTIRVRALNSIGPADVEGAHLVHLAYLTKEKAGQRGERYFTDTNLSIDDAVLGAMEKARPASVFVSSSGGAAIAASGKDPNAYGIAKLRQEARFLEAAERLQVPTMVGRIYNLAGPNINKIESYAISNFIDQALRGQRIRIEATVPVFRSFLHVLDLCELVLAAAEMRRGCANTIDFCGARVVEMADLAESVADAVGGDIAIDRDTIDFTRPSVYLGNFVQTRLLAMELGVALAPLERQVRDSIEWLVDSKATGVVGRSK